ncbi:hypothetical protein C0Q70_16303 [Pomacea canaliculata]|uniref:Uncharacterized protein n=1 Tax=Pomacea canaliculata TaxID=400727 RepID=A0A2T7NPE8_POMCA|nr:hypothetical protein C0Q70_16303 [Pomacea canaliculata]
MKAKAADTVTRPHGVQDLRDLGGESQNISSCLFTWNLANRTDSAIKREHRSPANTSRLQPPPSTLTSTSHTHPRNYFRERSRYDVMQVLAPAWEEDVGRGMCARNKDLMDGGQIVSTQGNVYTVKFVINKPPTLKRMSEIYVGTCMNCSMLNMLCRDFLEGRKRGEKN